MTIVPLPEACTPYSFFHYVFVNQNDLENNRVSEAIFEHEQTHVRQFHSIDVVFVEVLICFFWFNPFIWIYKRLIVENHEFLADAQVMKNGVNMDSYAHLLVQYRNYIFKSPLMSGFIFRQTKNRINMLYKPKKSNFVMLLKSGMVLGLFSVVFTLSSFSGNSGNERFIVLVDPGHGGDDPGAVGIEKTINLQIANKLAALGEVGEIEIVLTRKNDISLSLNDRVDLIENQKADLFLSLHCSALKDQESNGLVAYYSPKGNLSKLSHTFSKIMVSHYLKEIAERGEIKTANFFVLENSKIPALLLELGYLSNPQEVKQLKDHKFQQKIAENLYKGLLEIKAKN